MKHKDIVKEENKWRDRTSTEFYKWQWENNSGPIFVLHDGPPYANGHLHMGHALNKVVKDFINRYKALRGYRVNYIPGWDCHGLPIEHKSLKALGKSHLQLTPKAIREAARKTAEEAIEIQKKEFRALGVMADWDSPEGTYRTMDQDFEIRQLRLLQQMVEQGLLQHRKRPTYYSPSSRTALAEAEISWKDDHKSTSVYVYFGVGKDDMSSALRKHWEKVGNGRELGLAIWTTTAWTLAANQAVAISSGMDYAIVEQPGNDRLLVVGCDRLEPLKELLGELKVLTTFGGDDLLGTSYDHLFWNSSQPKPKVIASRHVTSGAGTGLVHTAPGHGQEDYDAFRQSLGSDADTAEMRCPVDDLGNLTEEIASWTKGGDVASRLVGKSVLGDAVPAMVEILKENGILLKQDVIHHRYPCDWKTKEPIIIRSSPQWFANVEAIRPTALRAIEGIDFKPPQSKRRLESFINGRSEWCISRQRSWGVPIPVLHDAQTGEPFLNSETLNHIILILEEKGTDHWWSESVDEFVPESLKSTGRQFRKGFDTMDVWFDSGSSWTILRDKGFKADSEPLADIYLEGSDQHRGWFQSSLLTRLCSAEKGQAHTPYSKVVTHGFVLAQDGSKMSKSSGNGIMPMDVIEGGKDKKKEPAFGTDTLRLWAASVEFTKDSHIGPTSLAMAAENGRKLRNVIKFLLGNSQRGQQPAPRLTHVDLGLLDRHILNELADMETDVIRDYEELYFPGALQRINTFVSGALSSLYFEETKDILYCDEATSPRRQAVAAVLGHILYRMTRILAPITPHLSEEVSHQLTEKPEGPLTIWTDDARKWHLPDVATKMEPLLKIRQYTMLLLEQARNDKALKTGKEAVLRITGGDAATQSLMQEHQQELAQIFSVAEVQVGKHSNLDEVKGTSAWTYSNEVQLALDSTAPIHLELVSSSKHKCPRCWISIAEESESLCTRCEAVVN